MQTRPKTHRDLLPKDVCPSLMMKHIATQSLDDKIEDDRPYAGDGYAWCLQTCGIVGPDDELVLPENCRPGRACWCGSQS